MVTNVDPLSLALLALFFAGILRGITGFGLLLVATPLLFLLYPPKMVIAALVLPGWMVNITILLRDGTPWEHLRSHVWLFVSGAVGAIVGVMGLIVLERQAIFLIVAAYILLFLVLEHAGDLPGAIADVGGMSAIAGGSGGLLGGTVGLAGPPIVTYLHAKDLGKKSFVGLLSVYFMVMDGVRLPSMVVAGLFGLHELTLAVLLSVPAVVGTYIGAVVRPRLPQRVFEIGVELFLLLVAVNLVSDALSIELQLL